MVTIATSLKISSISLFVLIFIMTTSFTKKFRLNKIINGTSAGKLNTPAKCTKDHERKINKRNQVKYRFISIVMNIFTIETWLVSNLSRELQRSMQREAFSLYIKICNNLNEL